MTVRVYVFTEKRANRKTRYRAYTIWASPEWKGCCTHTVDVANRRDAKRVAIGAHKANCP